MTIERASRLPELTSDSFEAAMTTGTSTVAVAFLADWCAPCRLFRPTLTAVAEALPATIRLVEVDVDTEPALASRYRVEALPTIIAFHAGRPILRLTGTRTEPQLLNDLHGVMTKHQTQE